MIVIMRQHTPQKEIDALTNALVSKGVQVNPVIGEDLTILGLVGDTSRIDQDWVEANRNPASLKLRAGRLAETALWH